jgi:hypothetical protein
MGAIMTSRKEVIELDWRENEDGAFATSELGWFTIWIELLDREGEGRFVWTLDTPLSNDGDEFMMIDCGVEASYTAAKIASAASLAHHLAMGIATHRRDYWRD